MEIWDIYNSNREKTGEVIERGSRPLKNKRHLVVNICIINKENKMLIQKRTATKEVWPSLWQVTASGSAVAGETSAEAAHRELLEEMGLDYSFTDKVPDITLTAPTSFRDFYIIHDEVDIKSLKLQKEEVADAKWATKEEILKMLRGKIFMPNYKNFIKLLFEI